VSKKQLKKLKPSLQSSKN